MTDGVIPSPGNYSDAGHVGFYATLPNPRITLDLGASYDLATVKLSYWADGTATYFGPRNDLGDRLLISVSNDNISYSTPVSYSPFTGPLGQEVTSSMDVTGKSGRYVRLLVQCHTEPAGVQWIWLSEVAVTSTAPDTGATQTVGVTKPVTRQVVQRVAANTGTIAIQGTYAGTPTRIEARAVVMAGSGNSGSDTAWITITPSPTGGTFSGSLGPVTAGGWYQIEVRSVTAGAPGVTSSVQRVGVGDVYLTAGQSNSANYGTPAGVCADDRVSSYNYSNGVWAKAADPMPGARWPWWLGVDAARGFAGRARQPPGGVRMHGPGQQRGIPMGAGFGWLLRLAHHRCSAGIPRQWFQGLPLAPGRIGRHCQHHARGLSDPAQFRHQPKPRGRRLEHSVVYLGGELSPVHKFVPGGTRGGRAAAGD